VRLYVASAGNEFMAEIASMLADGFAQLAVPCEVAIDEVPTFQDDHILRLVVAPHEFFPLFLSPRLTPGAAEEAASRLFVLNVEQPGSQWFELAWQYARVCRGAFDINIEGARELTRRGIEAVHAPLGFARRLESPHAATVATVERPIDILFLGHASRRREQFFARHADLFSALECRIVLADPARPRLEATPGYFSGASRGQLLGASKILLNVHSADREYFETHRALLALANGCLLVSESSRDTRPLVSGRHFVSGPLDALPELCARYLRDPQALSSVAEEGARFIRSDLDITKTCHTLLSGMEPASTTVRDRAHAERGDQEAREAVKERLTASLERRGLGTPDWTVTSNAAYSSSAVPAVTVAITLHNYAEVIGRCLDSVLASESVPGGLEVVVVDDGSSDDSADVAEHAVKTAQLPALIVRKRTNTGLADARNVGLQLARGARVFVLDADNWIYPACLRRLHAALGPDVGNTSGRLAARDPNDSGSTEIDSGSAARPVAAYGLIRRFDDETGEAMGLLSAYEWNVEALVRGPYLDAMAMFDRRVLLDVGGYSTELLDHGWFGWEDYDLWLKLAERDHVCRLVPNIVGVYRVHARSMIQRTNRSTGALAAHFQQKFARLASRHPHLDHYFGFPAAAGGRTSHSRPGRVVSGSIGPHDVDGGLAHRCQDLERELAAVYASGSWRVTSPLRFIFRLLTGRPY